MGFTLNSNSLAGLQGVYDGGTPAQKAAFQSSVSGVDIYFTDAAGYYLQQAINDCPEFGTIKLAPGRIILTDEIVIPKSITVTGAGVGLVHGPLGSANGQFDSPGKPPHLTGTVLVQTTAAKNGIRIGASAVQVNLSKIGVLFEGAHRFQNTGGGIVAQPDAYAGGSNHGIMHSVWSDLAVFGHDGNHYAYKAINPLHCVMRMLRSFGGGGVHWVCDSHEGNYGNTTFDSPFVHLFAGGTAHGYCLEGRTVGTSAGVLNLITLIRPQCNSTNQTVKFGVTATSSQYLFTAAPHGISTTALTVIGPDFETTVNSPVNFGNGNKFIDPSGIFGSPADTGSKVFQVMRSAVSGKVLNSDMTMSGKNLPAPTAVVGAAAGVGATVSVTGDDEVGTVTLTTGASGTAAFGGLFTVTFGRFTGVTSVQLTARNGNAGKTPIYVANKTSTTWVVNSADIAPQAGAQFVWDYLATRQ